MSSRNTVILWHLDISHLFNAELFLERDDVEKVHDFEEEAMEDLSRHKDRDYFLSTEQRIRATNERFGARLDRRDCVSFASKVLV